MNVVLDELPVKRLYLGHVVKVQCPKCPEMAIRNIDDDYISYPPVGQPFQLGVTCHSCWEEFDVPALLSMRLTIGDGAQEAA